MKAAPPAPDRLPLLVVRGLGVRYPDGGDTVHAVRGVDLEVAAGEAVGVLGESGCGKTSLLRAVAGLLPAGARVAGAVRFGGTSLLDLDEASWGRLRGDRLAIVYQQPSQALSPYRRVGRQIADVVRAHRRWRRDAVRARVRELLDEVAIDADVADAHPHQLSGGQLQRVVLCQALACAPELLLADEPTASLDADTESRILDLVAGLRARRGLALLWISHDPSVLERVSERLLVMHRGEIVEQGPTRRVLAAPEHDFTRGLLACRPGAAR